MADDDMQVQAVDTVNRNNGGSQNWDNYHTGSKSQGEDDKSIGAVGSAAGVNSTGSSPLTSPAAKESDESPSVKTDSISLSREIGSSDLTSSDRSGSLDAFSAFWNGMKNDSGGQSATQKSQDQYGGSWGQSIPEDTDEGGSDGNHQIKEAQPSAAVSQSPPKVTDVAEKSESTQPPKILDTGERTGSQPSPNSASGDDKKDSVEPDSGKKIKETDDDKDLKKISERLEGQKSFQKKMEGLKPEEREAIGKAGYEAYKDAVTKGDSEDNALHKAEGAAGKKVSAIQRDNSNIKDIHRKLDSSSDIKNRIKELDDSSKSSVYNAAEEAYRKVKDEGAEDWKAVRAATEAGNDKSKEVRRDSDRAKEIEKLSPEDQARVDKVRQRAVTDGQTADKSNEEIKKITDKALDRQLTAMNREKSLEESMGKMTDEQKENMRREMDRAYVEAAKQGRNDEEVIKEAVDRGKIVEKLDSSQSIRTGMKEMSQEEKSSMYQRAHDSYRQEMEKSGDDRKAMQKADDSARMISGDVQREHSNIRDVKKSIESGGESMRQMKGFDDKEKSSVNQSAEGAYKKARESGESASKAKETSRAAGVDRLKEIQKDRDRSKEIEKFDPAVRERVQGAMQQASQNAALSGADELGKERAAGKAGDMEIKDIKNEQFVDKYKGKMSTEDQQAVDKARQEAYDNAISEGRSPTDARREGTKAAMDKVEPYKTLPPLEVPKNYSEKVKTFGQPGSNQVKRKMAAGKNGEMINVDCNAKLADRMETMFQELKDRDMSHLLKQDFGGCSYYRDTTGGGSLSNHSWGIAFDVNAGFPGNGYDTSYPTEDQDRLAEFFGKYGFKQLKNDRMHFEYCQ
ncbi:MAG: M15 family metallopeptidase [Candidatus Xenobiia bacterium LiM19]